MARQWTLKEEELHRVEMERLYVRENRTISEIARLLNISDSGVYDRLLRLNVKTCRSNKLRFNNRRSDVHTPTDRSERLAELFGILMGDGHVGHFQVMVTLGTKERQYARYVQRLMRDTFGGVPKITTSSRGDRTVYLGSTAATQWLYSEGFVANKVGSQVDAPSWIFEKSGYMSSFLRGFFDTDGSVYSLRWGIQLSFTNRSLPLLHALHKMACGLGYKPSAVTGFVFYITNREQVKRFFAEIKPANTKHCRRFEKIMRRWRSSKRTRL